MPPVALDVIAVAALLTLLTVAFTAVSARVETVVSATLAALVLILGAVPGSSALTQVERLFPVVAFLVAILVVSELCDRLGLFSYLGAVLGRRGAGRPVWLLGATFLVAAVVTAVLSLDATVVLLTPVVAAAAATAGVASRPAVFACVRLANSASLLLPVSNLTNLLALPQTHLSFAGWTLLMAPVTLVVVIVEYIGHRLYFRKDLVRSTRDPTTSGVGATDTSTSRAQAPVEAPVEAPVLPLVVVVLMLVGFAVGSPLGVAPAWVAGLAAVVLAVATVRAGRASVREVLASTRLSFAVYVLSLGVVVAAVASTFLGRLVAGLLPQGRGLAGIVLLALLATVLANLVNNLPATLLLVPLVAPLGPTAVLAVVVGLNVGSGLTYTGSLANLLWRRVEVRRTRRSPTGDFHRLSALVTLPAVVLAAATLWAWASLLGQP